eukprot:PhM_4_TR3298/c0_g1_i1/m.96694
MASHAGLAEHDPLWTSRDREQWRLFVKEHTAPVRGSVMTYLHNAMLHDNDVALRVLMETHLGVDWADLIPKASAAQTPTTTTTTTWQCTHVFHLFARMIEEDAMQCMFYVMQTCPEVISTVLYPVGGLRASHIAARCNNVNAMKLLMCCGADVCSPDLSGDTPLHHASAQKPDIPNGTSLVHLLLGAPPFTYSVNARECVNLADGLGRTPLHIAVAHSTVNVVELLLSAGACEDIVCEPHGTPPLVLAAKVGNKEMLDLMIAKAKERGSNVAVADKQGFTARDWNEQLCATEIPSSIPDGLPEGAECVVCMNIMLHPVTLMCGHMVCFSCACKSIHQGMCVFRCGIRTNRFDIDYDKEIDVKKRLREEFPGIGDDYYKKREDLEYVSRAQVLLDSIFGQLGVHHVDLFNMCEVRYAFRVENIRPTTLDVGIVFVRDTVIAFNIMTVERVQIVSRPDASTSVLQKYMEASMRSRHGIGFVLGDDDSIVAHCPLQVTACKTDALTHFTDVFCNHASTMARHFELGSDQYTFPETEIDSLRLSESVVDLRKVTEMVRQFETSLDNATSFYATQTEKAGLVHVWVICSDTLLDTTINFYEGISVLASAVPFSLQYVRHRGLLLHKIAKRRLPFTVEPSCSVVYEPSIECVILKLTVYVGCVLEPFLKDRISKLKELCDIINGMITEHNEQYQVNGPLTHPRKEVFTPPMSRVGDLQYHYRLLVQLVSRPNAAIFLHIRTDVSNQTLDPATVAKIRHTGLTLVDVGPNEATLPCLTELLDLLVHLTHETAVSTLYCHVAAKGTVVHTNGDADCGVITADNAVLPLSAFSCAATHMASNGTCVRVVFQEPFTSLVPPRASFHSDPPPDRRVVFDWKGDARSCSALPGWDDLYEGNIMIWWPKAPLPATSKSLLSIALDYFLSPTRNAHTHTVEDFTLHLADVFGNQCPQHLANCPAVYLSPMFPLHTDSAKDHMMARVVVRAKEKSTTARSIRTVWVTKLGGPLRAGLYAVFGTDWRCVGTVRCNQDGYLEKVSRAHRAYHIDTVEYVVLPLHGIPKVHTAKNLRLATTLFTMNEVNDSGALVCVENADEPPNPALGKGCVPEPCVERDARTIERRAYSTVLLRRVVGSPFLRVQDVLDVTAWQDSTLPGSEHAMEALIHQNVPLTNSAYIVMRKPTSLALTFSTKSPREIFATARKTRCFGPRSGDRDPALRRTCAFEAVHRMYSLAHVRGLMQIEHRDFRGLPEQIAIVPEERFWDHVAQFFASEEAVIQRSIDRVCPEMKMSQPYIVEKVQSIMRLIVVRYLSRGIALRENADLTWAYMYLSSAECEVNAYCPYATLLRQGVPQINDCGPLTAVHIQNSLVFVHMFNSFEPTCRIVLADYAVRASTTRTMHMVPLRDAVKSTMKMGDGARARLLAMANSGPEGENDALQMDDVVHAPERLIDKLHRTLGVWEFVLPHEARWLRLQAAVRRVHGCGPEPPSRQALPLVTSFRVRPTAVATATTPVTGPLTLQGLGRYLRALHTIIWVQDVRRVDRRFLLTLGDSTRPIVVMPAAEVIVEGPVTACVRWTCGAGGDVSPLPSTTVYCFHMGGITTRVTLTGAAGKDEDCVGRGCADIDLAPGYTYVFREDKSETHCVVRCVDAKKRT